MFVVFFFFQAEDGIRDLTVTGVQTCALPYALACGGTRPTASGASIASEVVWNETSANEGATGGGARTPVPPPALHQGTSPPPRPQRPAGRGGPPLAATGARRPRSPPSGA